MSVLPYAREVSKSINVGMPVLGFAPNSDVSRRLADGLRAFLPEEARDRVPELATASSSNILARLFHRRPSVPAQN